MLLALTSLRFLVLTAATLVAVSTAGSGSTLGWTYSGALGPTWWTQSYDGCNTAAQSPINLDSTTISSASQSIRIVRSSGGAILQTNALFSMQTSNTIRADLWFGDTAVHILWNGEAASDARKYVLHHVSVHFGAEHTYDGVQAIGELRYMFYPYVDRDSQGKMRDNGVSFSFPFNSHASTAQSRLDTMLQGLAVGLTLDAGVGQMAFSFPEVTSALQYSGSMTFPPCLTATMVVSAQPILLHAVTVAALQALIPSGTVTTRPLQAVNGRILTPVTLSQTSLVASLPTLAAMQAQAPEVLLDMRQRDYANDVYHFGAILAGCVCGFLGFCVIALVAERRTFVSHCRDTWYNFVTGVSVFGVPGLHDVDDGDEGENDEEYEEEDEEGTEDDDS